MILLFISGPNSKFTAKWQIFTYYDDGFFRTYLSFTLLRLFLSRLTVLFGTFLSEKLNMNYFWKRKFKFQQLSLKVWFGQNLQQLHGAASTHVLHWGRGDKLQFSSQITNIIVQQILSYSF